MPASATRLSWVPALALLVFALAASAGCRRRGPRDLGNEHPKSAFAEGPTPGSVGGELDDAGTDGGRILATPPAAGVRPRELAKASSRAIALDAANVYFGDSEDDGVYAVPKTGGEMVRVARRAPMPSSLSIEGTTLVWIGTPGDVVLRATVGSPAAPVTLRERGLFTGAALSKGEVFVVEAAPSQGILARSGMAAASTAVKLATFDGSPRAAVIDDERVYIATSTRLVGAARRKSGDVTALSTGNAFAHPAVDDAWVYATIPLGQGRARSLVRVSKAGGALETIATGVRDAPIAVYAKQAYWFDAERPALLAAATTSPGGGSPRTISEDETLDQPAALAVDADGVFVAAGFAEEGKILVIKEKR